MLDAVMAVDVIVGLQRGDEGKGRFVDMLAENYDIVARFNGGDNAGHTVVLPDGEEFKLHLIPSGITRPNILNIIGNGTFVNPSGLVREIDRLHSKHIEVNADNLMISSAAHLILPHHISMDEVRETGKDNQGSTKSGIHPVASDKALRTGARVEMINNDPERLLALIVAGLQAQRKSRAEAKLAPINDEEAVAHTYLESALKIGSFVTDTVLFLNRELRKGKRVLAEGAQAFLLDIDHGMSPYTTSSTTISGGVSPGLGIPPHYIEKVIGVAKAVPSHVGGGPFVTETVDPVLQDQLHGDLEAPDAEKGTKTGRKRRLGNLDLAQIRRALMVNGTPGMIEMGLTKLDWVPRYGAEAPICVGYQRKDKMLKASPDAAYKLGQSEPQYEFLPTWEGDISEVRNFSDLPKNAQRYVEFIEAQTEVPITMIGVGRRRDQVIIRSA